MSNPCHGWSQSNQHAGWPMSNCTSVNIFFSLGAESTSALRYLAAELDFLAFSAASLNYYHMANHYLAK
ncbi:hypothetical protein ACTXT7_013131 [Hymenolepis weldensis]